MEAIDIDALLKLLNNGKTVYDYVAQATNMPPIPDRGSHHLPNPFRDGHGSVSIQFYKDRWRHRDFGDTTYSGDCFNWAACHFGESDFSKVIELIAEKILDQNWETTSTDRPQPQPEQPEQTVFYTAEQIASRAWAPDGKDTFVNYFLNRWGSPAQDVLNLYMVGQAFDQRTIFWYIDRQNQGRAAKLIRYWLRDGSITKKGPNGVDIYIKRPPKQPSDPCLFGEHLATPNSPCAIVESEDSALTAALHHPEITWLASGGPVSQRHLRGVKDCELLIVPDHDVFNDATKLSTLNGNIQRWITEGYNVKVWPLMLTLAAESASIMPAAKLAKMDPRDYFEATQT